MHCSCSDVLSLPCAVTVIYRYRCHRSDWQRYTVVPIWSGRGRSDIPPSAHDPERRPRVCIFRILPQQQQNPVSNMATDQQNDNKPAGVSTTGGNSIATFCRRRTRGRTYSHIMTRVNICTLTFHFNTTPSSFGLSRPRWIFNIFQHHYFRSCHVLSRRIQKSPFRPSAILSYLSHPQLPSPNIPSIFPPYTSKPRQSCLSWFLSKSSHLRCPTSVLIPGRVHSRHP